MPLIPAAPLQTSPIDPDGHDGPPVGGPDDATSLQPGNQASVELVVTNDHVAAKLTATTGIPFPPVLSTPWLVAQLECAAASLLMPLLKPGQTSVGTRIAVEHVAPTPKGKCLTATARFIGRDGNAFLFDVWADDGVGIVGKGSHSRAIAPLAAINDRAERRHAA